MSKWLRFFINPGSTATFGILTAVFTLVPEEVFKLGLVECNWSESWVIVVNRVILSVIVLAIAEGIYYYRRNNRKEVAIKERTFSVIIEYGNIFNIKKGKKVIAFDECFTTNIGDKPEDIKPDSVCGQYLTKYPINDIKSIIKESNVNPSGKSLFANRESYTPGTIVQREDFLLMAFAKLNEKGIGTISYEEYIKALDELWNQINIYHGMEDVYLPILGSGVTRFDKALTQQELLDIMIASYRLSPNKLKRPYTLHIVCKELEGFNINEVFGVK